MTAESTTITNRAALRPLLSAMRPYQWPKNVLVFAALVFSAGDSWKPGDTETWWPLLWRTSILFGLWCLASSATYIFNDVQDREADSVHPRKRRRPIASGVISASTAVTMAVLLGGVAVFGAVLLDRLAGVVVAGYIAVMVAYSAGLKRVAIVDILVLCGGVVARAVAGAVTIDVEISPWLYVCSSFAAFFFASSKRWAEYRQLGSDAFVHRPSLAQYGGELLNQIVTISAAAALLSYALYTIESDNVPRSGSMALTLPFVAFALFRYLLLLGGERRADAPDQIVFTDPQIVLAVLGFGATALTVLLLNR